MTYALITDSSLIDRSAWSAFIAGHPEGNVFQSPDMFSFFSEVPRFDPVVCAAVDEQGRIAGILSGVTIREMKGPLAFFSARTVVYGGPLTDPAAPDRDAIAEMLLDGLTGLVSHSSVFTQFRNFFSMEGLKDRFFARRFSFRDRLNLILDTSSRETVIRNMSASRWRQIQKGLGTRHQKPGTPGTPGTIGTPGTPGTPGTIGTRNQEPGTDTHARIIIPSDISQVREFYDILYRLYKYKVKKPLPPREFFEHFFQYSKEGKLGVILLVEYRGKIVGGILSPVTPGRTIFEWYVCGLDREYRDVHPSVVATWAAIEYAFEHGIPRFDFMGVGIPGREYGVREFKSRFGGEQVNYGRFARVNNRFVYGLAEFGYNILSVLRRI